jgi:hypothetical protein
MPKRCIQVGGNENLVAVGEDWRMSMFGVCISIEFDTSAPENTHGDHDGIG